MTAFAPVLVAPPKVQTIRLSSGESKFTWGATITELKGIDISADPMLMGLNGQQDIPPATGTIPADSLISSTITMQNWILQGGPNPFFLPPTTVLHQLTGSVKVSASGLNPAAGSYWVWARLTDQTEIQWFPFHKVIIA